MRREGTQREVSPSERPVEDIKINPFMEAKEEEKEPGGSGAAEEEQLFEKRRTSSKASEVFQAHLRNSDNMDEITPEEVFQGRISAPGKYYNGKSKVDDEVGSAPTQGHFQRKVETFSLGGRLEARGPR